jgi:hypothetical protein
MGVVEPHVSQSLVTVVFNVNIKLRPIYLEDCRILNNHNE